MTRMAGALSGSRVRTGAVASLIRCGVLALLCAAGSNGQEAPMRAYPASIYPPSANQIARTSEVPFTETAETRRYGFDVPFPNVARKTFAVDDFGAKADGVTDCTAAFYAALAAAKASRGPAEIVFRESGRYLFLPSPVLGSSDMAILDVMGVSDLLIRGQGHGTVLMMGDPALGGLLISYCNTVKIQDFAIDYNILPFTQGTVTELDAEKGTFTLRLHEGYPTPAQIAAAIPGNHAGYSIARAGDGKYKWPGIGALWLKSSQPGAGRDWHFEADPKALAGYLAKGTEFIYVGRRIAQTALGAANVRAFYLQNVVIHASPTCGFGVTNVDGLNIDGYADTIPAGSDRLLASNADGIYYQGVRGGLTVRNSYFNGQGDDCMNLHCPALAGLNVTVVSDREIVIKADLDLRAGDKLQIMDPTTARLKGLATVTSVTRAPDRSSVRCTFAVPLTTLGYDPKVDFIYPTALAVPNFKIVHNYFGQNRSRCLLIGALGGLIEANTGENAEGYGVRFEYGGTAWHEGVHAQDIIIRRNIFRNVTGFGLAPTIEGGDGTKSRNYRNITIEDNQFINPRKMAVLMANCDGLRIIRNTVTTEPGRRNTWNHPQWYPVDCSIYLDNCSGALVDGLRIRDPNLKEAVVYIGKTCDPGAKGVEIHDITADVPAGVPLVKDARQ
jgi:hypothetical protein